MYLAVNIPEVLLARLRAGAQEAMLAPIMEPGDWDRERRARFAGARELLDQIGWKAGETGEEVTIDMVEHAHALHDALDYALTEALSDLSEFEHSRREPSARRSRSEVDKLLELACISTEFSSGKHPRRSARLWLLRTTVHQRICGRRSRPDRPSQTR